MSANDTGGSNTGDGTGGGTGMVTFTDRRQLRDGVRNQNLDDNFALLAAGLQAGGIGPTGPAGTDGIDGTDGIIGTNGTNGTDGTNSTVPGPQGPQGPQGPAGVGGIGDTLDGGRSDSVYTADQSIIGGGA